MKILVCGGLGFIGSHFVEAAEAAGHDVYVIDALTYAGRTANLAWGRRWHKCDIADQLLVEHHLRTFRPDWVVNLAAESHVTKSIGNRGPFLDTNVIGTQRLLDACLSYWRDDICANHDAFRVLHVSTDEVYGSLGRTDKPWDEYEQYAPNNPYAASKAAGDHIVRAYHRTFDLPVITTHSSNNYGSRQHPEKLIPALIERCRRGQPMQLHGDGQNIRDWLHVADHCQGLLLALKYGEVGNVYNFGGECERTNWQIADLVATFAVQKWDGGIELVDDRPGNDRRYSTDVRKAHRRLGWAPGPQIEDRLGAVVEWYLENPDYEAGYGR